MSHLKTFDEALSTEDQKIIGFQRTVEDCRRFIKVHGKTHPHLIKVMNRRTVAIRTANHETESEVIRAIWQAFYAYEEVLYIKHGYAKRATYTLKSIKEHGEIEAVDRLVRKPKDTDGFTRMAAAGLLEMTFEAVVLHYHDKFSPEAVAAARRKLSEENR